MAHIALLPEHNGTIMCSGHVSYHVVSQIAYVTMTDSVVGTQTMCLQCWMRFTNTLIQQRETAYTDLEAANKEITDQLQVITEMKWALLPVEEDAV